jgi:indole-3-glycerol phosphate synthase
LNPNSTDFLDILVQSAYSSIADGYYDLDSQSIFQKKDLKSQIIHNKKNSIISEVKFISPSYGVIKSNIDAVFVAKAMVQGGAIGLSILTEPKHFGGSLENFSRIRKEVSVPLLMKDIFVSTKQIDSAKKLGADVILFIQSLFERQMCESDVENMIEYAHLEGIQVLLEVHNKDEYEFAIGSEADLVGINNRNLETFSVNLHTTIEILESIQQKNKIVVSESGINSIDDIRLLKNSGADAFLIGTSVMKAPNITKKVEEMVDA